MGLPGEHLRANLWCLAVKEWADYSLAAGRVWLPFHQQKEVEHWVLGVNFCCRNLKKRKSLRITVKYASSMIPPKKTGPVEWPLGIFYDSLKFP